MSKQKKHEESMSVATEAPKTEYRDLYHKIEALQGKEKQAFCKLLRPEEKKAYIEFCKERDSIPVTGVFRCFEPMGGMVKVTYSAYDTGPVTQEFYDGQTYTIPKYLAKRFESDFQGSGTWYPTHSHVLDATGNPIVGVGKKNRRFGFSSLDFQ